MMCSDVLARAFLVGVLCFAASGCCDPDELQAVKDDLRAERLLSSELREANSGLRKRSDELAGQYDVLREEHVKLVDVVRAMLISLREIGEREGRIRIIIDDMGGGDVASRSGRVDYKTEIDNEIDRLRDDMNDLVLLVGDLKDALDSSELQSASLEDSLYEVREILRQKGEEVKRLEAEVDALRLDKVELSGAVERLQGALEVASEEIAAQQRRIMSLSEAVGEGYLIVGNRRDLSLLRSRGLIVHEGDSLAPGRNIDPERVGVALEVVDLNSSEIRIGRFSRIEVRSGHRVAVGRLYSVEHRNGVWYLKLRDPSAFWELSRYLIVRVD